MNKRMAYSVHLKSLIKHFLNYDAAMCSRGIACCFAMLFVCHLSSCASNSTSKAQVSAHYYCRTPEVYSNTRVGDGHCVSLIRACSSAPITNQWKPGQKVMDLGPNSIPYGTIIATFKNGHYPSRRGYHAAIYIKHSVDGIWVWDQWQGKRVHKRLIRVRYDKAEASNTAQAYRIVM